MDRRFITEGGSSRRGPSAYPPLSQGFSCTLRSDAVAQKLAFCGKLTPVPFEGIGTGVGILALYSGAFVQLQAKELLRL